MIKQVIKEMSLYQDSFDFAVKKQTTIVFGNFLIYQTLPIWRLNKFCCYWIALLFKNYREQTRFFHRISKTVISIDSFGKMSALVLNLFNLFEAFCVGHSRFRMIDYQELFKDESIILIYQKLTGQPRLFLDSKSVQVL